MSPLQDEAYTYDPRPDYPFLLCVKRYTHRDLSADSSDPTAITLLLTHSVGLHKEQWEPVLQDLFGLLGTANSIGVGGTKLKIREIWAIDLPDCGESGRMNEMTFGKGTHERHPVFRWDEYGKALHRFLISNLKDFSLHNHNLVVVAPSTSVLSVIHMQKCSPSLPLRCAILCEPVLFANGVAVNTSPSNDWDERNVELYKKYAFKEPVMTPVHAMDNRTPDVRAFADLCAAVPTHVIVGGKHDYVPEGGWDKVLQEYSGGRLKTVTSIDDAVHLMVQTTPTSVAEKIWSCLLHPSSGIVSFESTELLPKPKL